MSKTKKIAIAGSISSGKSEVLSYLRQQGFVVFSADEIVAKLYQEDQKLISEIGKLTNNSVITDNIVDKKKLAQIFFNDDKLKKNIEALVHKEVYEYLFNQSNDDVTFYEIPLLFETSMEALFDEVLYVYIDPIVQKQRAIEYRKLSEADFETRLKAQLPQIQKMHRSDVVLNNSYTKQHLHYQIDQYLKRRGYDSR